MRVSLQFSHEFLNLIWNKNLTFQWTQCHLNSGKKPLTLVEKNTQFLYEFFASRLHNLANSGGAELRQDSNIWPNLNAVGKKIEFLCPAF